MHLLNNVPFGDMIGTLEGDKLSAVVSLVGESLDQCHIRETTEPEATLVSANCSIITSSETNNNSTKNNNNNIKVFESNISIPIETKKKNMGQIGTKRSSKKTKVYSSHHHEFDLRVPPPRGEISKFTGGSHGETYIEFNINTGDFSHNQEPEKTTNHHEFDVRVPPPRGEISKFTSGSRGETYIEFNINTLDFSHSQETENLTNTINVVSSTENVKTLNPAPDNEISFTIDLKPGDDTENQQCLVINGDSEPVGSDSGNVEPAKCDSGNSGPIENDISNSEPIESGSDNSEPVENVSGNCEKVAQSDSEISEIENSDTLIRVPDKIETNIKGDNSGQDNIEQDTIEDDNIEEVNVEEDNIEEDNNEEDIVEEENIEEGNIEPNNIEENDIKQDNIEVEYIEEDNIEVEEVESFDDLSDQGAAAAATSTDHMGGQFCEDYSGICFYKTKTLLNQAAGMESKEKVKVDESEPVGGEEPPFEKRDIMVKKDKWVTDLYAVDGILGKGKFGEVKKCREHCSGRQLAAKFIEVGGVQDRKDILNEVDIMKSLQHPRLLQLYDAFEHRDRFCLVMELVNGGELFERVINDDFILTEKACVMFMRQICDGVSFMHSQSILHLDMKPENILCLTREGNRIKIIDFGLARKYNPRADMRVLFGTPEFVAPEVVNFDPISPATDMWSIGVICYVLLSGLSPFMGESEQDTLSNVTFATWDFNAEEFNSISKEAKDFISKLLIKDPRKRLTSTACLDHQWLRRSVKREGNAPDMSRSLSKKRLRKFVYRRKWQTCVKREVNAPGKGRALTKKRPQRKLTYREQWQKAINAMLALRRMGVTLS